MKLNNNGWGTKELIISACIILILLLIIVFNIQKLYKNLEDSMNTNNETTIREKKNNNEDNQETIEVENSNEGNASTTEEDTQNNNYDIGTIDTAYYKNYEERLTTATKDYIIETNYQVTNVESTINLATIINNNYINALKDINDNSPCNGYVKVVLGDQYNILINPYISCSSYMTEGY